eukprot:1136116-Prymnesium_polylepis.2
MGPRAAEVQARALPRPHRRDADVRPRREAQGGRPRGRGAVQAQPGLLHIAHARARRGVRVAPGSDAISRTDARARAV